MRDFAATRDIYVVLPMRQDRSAERGADELPLLREMHHRMANSMTLLTAQLWNEFGSSKSPEVRGSLKRFEARIAAFGNLHRLLAIGARDRRIAVRPYVEELCQTLSEAVLAPLGVRSEVSVDDGTLQSGILRAAWSHHHRAGHKCGETRICRSRRRNRTRRIGQQVRPLALHGIR